MNARPGLEFNGSHAESTASPVLSVSPRAAGLAGSLDSRVLITLPMIRPDSLGELTSTLRALVTDAAGSARRLIDHLRQASQMEARAARATGELQDRLRLGAGMLRAMQAQIDHVDAAAAQCREQQRQTEAVAAQLDAQFAQFQQRLDALAETFEARMRETAAATAAQLERHIARLSAELAAHRRRLRPER
jgi:DNA repair exonuclease SbcCD ATPase subunit